MLAGCALCARATGRVRSEGEDRRAPRLLEREGGSSRRRREGERERAGEGAKRLEGRAQRFDGLEESG